MVNSLDKALENVTSIEAGQLLGYTITLKKYTIGSTAATMVLLLCISILFDIYFY